jgi:hypothetical protein
MIDIFDVTLDRFVITGGKPLGAEGLKPIGKLKAKEILKILEIFRDIAPTTSFEDEPGVIIQTREGKYSVRTQKGQLMVYNLKNREEPAIVLEAKELVAEVDGSAAAERKAHLQAQALAAPSQEKIDDTVLPYIPPPQVRTPTPWKLFAATFLAVAWTIFSVVSSDGSDFQEPDSIINDRAEISQQREAVGGVYLTGNTPGHHGLVINTDGSIKLFQINRQLPPSILYDTYELVNQKGQLCLTTHQPGCLIMVKDKDTLLYCDETYKRVH